MTKTINTHSLRNNLSEILNEVHYKEINYIINRRDKPFAVIISYDEYEKLKNKEKK